MKSPRLKTNWVSGIGLLILLWSQSAKAEIKFRLPWSCQGIDTLAAEASRQGYFREMKDTALRLLEENRVPINLDLANYSQDFSRLPAGHISRQAARLQRENFHKVLTTRQALLEKMNFYEMASQHARFAQEGILGMLNWSAGYPEDAEQQVLEILDSLAPYGFVVVRQSPANSGNFFDLGGNRVNIRDGRYYIDLDVDLRPFLRIEISNPTLDWSCWQDNRLTQIQDTVNRDYLRLRAMYELANTPMPVLELEVPGHGIRQWMSKPQVSELVQQQIDSGCEQMLFECRKECDESFPEFMRSYALAEWQGCLDICERFLLECRAHDVWMEESDFWNAMKSALEQILQNIEVEEQHIQEMSIDNINDLATMPIVRMEVLSRHPEFQGIDCVVMAEISLQDIGVAAGGLLLGLAATGFAAAGHPYVSYALYSAATFLGIVSTAKQYVQYKEAQRAYFTSLEGYGLLPREVYIKNQRAFLFSLATSILNGAFWVKNGWRLHQLAMKSAEAMNATRSILDPEAVDSLGVDDVARLVNTETQVDAIEVAKAISQSIMKSIAKKELTDLAAANSSQEYDETLERIVNNQPAIESPDAVVQRAEIAGFIRRVLLAYPEAQPVYLRQNLGHPEPLLLAPQKSWSDLVLWGRNQNFGPEAVGTIKAGSVIHFGATTFRCVVMPDGSIRYATREFRLALAQAFGKIGDCADCIGFYEMTRAQKAIGFGEVTVQPDGAWCVTGDAAISAQFGSPEGYSIRYNALDYPTVMEIASRYGFAFDKNCWYSAARAVR